MNFCPRGGRKKLAVTFSPAHCRRRRRRRCRRRRDPNLRFEKQCSKKRTFTRSWILLKLRIVPGWWCVHKNQSGLVVSSLSPASGNARQSQTSPHEPQVDILAGRYGGIFSPVGISTRGIKAGRREREKERKRGICLY